MTLFDDRVAAVGGFGLDEFCGVVGEQGVVAPRREQWVLQFRRVAFGDPAHDQPGGDLLAGRARRNAVYSTSAISAA